MPFLFNLLLIGCAVASDPFVLIQGGHTGQSFSFAKASVSTGEVTHLSSFPSGFTPSITLQTANDAANNAVWLPGAYDVAFGNSTWLKLSVPSFDLVSHSDYTPPGSLLWFTFYQGKIMAMFGTDFYLTKGVFGVFDPGASHTEFKPLLNISLGGVIYHASDSCLVGSSLFFSWALGASGPYFVGEINLDSVSFSFEKLQYQGYGYGIQTLATTNNNLYALVYDYNDHLIQVLHNGTSVVVGDPWPNVAGSDKLLRGDTQGNVFSITYSPQVLRGANVVDKTIIPPVKLQLAELTYIQLMFFA